MIIVILAIRRICNFFFGRSHLFTLSIIIKISAYEFEMLYSIKMNSFLTIFDRKFIFKKYIFQTIQI